MLTLESAAAQVQFGADDPSVDPSVLLSFELPTKKLGVTISKPTEKFSMQVTPATGLFRGVFRDPQGKSRTYRGVLLQPAEVGFGFYLHESGAGAVLIREE